MLKAQQNKYLQTSVQTATPAQLLIMLYDGAIRYCRAGIAAIEKNNFEEANRNIAKAQDIIIEFVITLDKKSPLAEQLLLLYDYFVNLLIEANMSKKPEPIERVIGHLLEMKETWIQASLTIKNNQKKMIPSEAQHG